MKILEEKENFLLNRKEVKVIVVAEKTPTYEEVTNSLNEKFKTDKENIVVRGVKGKFGRNTFLVTGFIYKTKEDRDRFEPKKRGKKEEEKKSEEKKVEAEQKPGKVAEQKTQPIEEKKEVEEKEEKKKERTEEKTEEAENNK